MMSGAKNFEVTLTLDVSLEVLVTREVESVELVELGKIDTPLFAELNLIMVKFHRPGECAVGYAALH